MKIRIQITSFRFLFFSDGKIGREREYEKAEIKKMMVSGVDAKNEKQDLSHFFFNIERKIESKERVEAKIGPERRGEETERSLI